jgi:3-carboxy-cis,cis-muconate cycloisomerase
MPWHVSRDSVAEFGFFCSSLAATCSRFARETIDLSRTEIAEVREQGGHLRGASSSMPQKVNPINSEAIVGMAATSGVLAAALGRAMEAGHKRAAGVWQVEWQVLPQLAGLAAGCLGRAAEMAANLRVFPRTMRRNLEADGGLIMAEAYMMRLAPSMGRERAHDLVYRAASEASKKESGLRRPSSPSLPTASLTP